jgi:hypothetical protein
MKRHAPTAKLGGTRMGLLLRDRYKMSIVCDTDFKPRGVSGVRRGARLKEREVPARKSVAAKSKSSSKVRAPSYVLIEVAENGRIDSGLNVHPRDADRMVDALILMLAQTRRIGRS